jgi:hypothetical protein
MKVLRYFPKASVDLAAVLFFWRSSNHAESPWQKSAMRFSVWDWSYLFPSEYGGWSRRHSINSDQDAARTAGHPDPGLSALSGGLADRVAFEPFGPTLPGAFWPALARSTNAALSGAGKVTSASISTPESGDVPVMTAASSPSALGPNKAARLRRLVQLGLALGRPCEGAGNEPDGHHVR